MEKIEYFVELKDGWLWGIFFGGMDVGGVWGEGGKEGCCGAGLDGISFWKGEGMGSWLLFWMMGVGVGMIWLLVLLLLRVGIVRIIILMHSYYQSA